ncbi:fibronectin type III domain-containing protein 11 [Rhinatrema bivittatum]|uniref:fibronectin type III domain-containing protein 11 n=1 Tax=Rhinatrema bivittatum TaxID=194408 RepID=UPI00112BBC59|nr:fibronectin type III domain-containing protein 11 [Rhinatrema bivittatum]XP_029468753.1 fibronectin type III domain-containing protein 11 [Rhinatrema bivittatum]XP_029468754.1 fibronectin type III domain-containing protein 11 [Rhinatrema bivittatum]
MSTHLVSKLCSQNSVMYGVEEQEDEAWKLYQERKGIVLEFLSSELSLSLLKRHQTRVELLKKCSYYIDILPKHLALGDQNHLMLPTAMFQLIDPWKFQRMKKVGTAQTRLQLLLLGELLEQLKQGRAALVDLLKSYDTATFLSEWETISRRLSELSALLDDFLATLVPGKLHIKHRLVSDIGTTKIPHIRLVLRTKMPVVFDRKESIAHEDRACLKWFSMGQLPQPEQFELRLKLLDPQTQQERVQSGSIPVSSSSFEVKNLLSDRLYEFSIKRLETYTLVYETWNDSITLRTKPLQHSLHPDWSTGRS